MMHEFGGMMGFGYGWSILGLFFWFLVTAGVVLLVKWLWGQERPISTSETALEILKKRYARGEISKEEFEEKKKDLA